MPTYLDGDPTWLGSLPLNVTDDAGVDWIVTGNGGWKGSPATTQQPTQRQTDHGAYPSAAYLTPRNLPLAVTIKAPDKSALDEAIEQIKAAATLTATTLRVQSARYDRTATVYAQGEVLVTEYGAAADVSLSLVATDPRLYGTVGYSASCNLPSTSGGLTFPIILPALFTATVSSGQIPVGNLGNIGSRPLLRITGPCVTPLVTLQRPDGGIQQLTYNGTLAALDFLDLDCDRHTAILDGTANRRGLLTVNGGWPEIPAGAHSDECSLLFNAASTTGAPTLTASWADTWK
jgi:hypothetical protein